MEKGKIRIYGCGGMGTNASKYFAKTNGAPYIAEVTPCFIDTSRSNLDESISDSDVFILENVDGSGKVRSENHKEISAVVKKIVHTFSPLDMNVVVFSGSGGSGSVIGPLIVRELLAKDQNVVVCMVGTHESVITATNTLNTIKSLEAISKKASAPVVMYYDRNNGDRKRTEVDVSIRKAITSLGVLASKRNAEMDSRDIGNFLNFSRVSSVDPCLASLSIYDEGRDVADVPDPVSIASLYSDHDMPQIDATPEYACAGYFRDDVEEVDELHFVIGIDDLPSIVRDLKVVIDKYEDRKESRVRRNDLLDHDDDVTDDGLVLG